MVEQLQVKTTHSNLPSALSSPTVLSQPNCNKPSSQAGIQQINRYFSLSLASLGLATLGTVAYPPLSLASAALLTYISIPLFQQAYHSVRHERQIKIAILDAIVSASCLVTGYYIPCAMMCSLVYGGRKVLTRTEDNSRSSLLDIFGLQSSMAWLYKDGIEIEQSLDTLKPGDIVVVYAGETIPVDGVVVQGAATVDQHILTGESQPAEKEVGQKVFASTVALTGKIFVEIEQAGTDTTAAKIATILNQTADFKSSLQSRGEAYSDRSALPTLGVRLLALLTTGPMAAITILNASFAWYMRVLAPIGMLNFLNLSSHHGILIKDGRVLDILKKVDTIVFDKTGTLTYAQPHVGQIYTCADYTAEEILMYAAAAEYKQTHPIALAILAEANARQMHVPSVDEADYKVGYGISVQVEHHIVHVGSSRFMEIEGFVIPAKLQKIQETSHVQGVSLVMVAVNGIVSGALEMRPTVRPEAKAIIAQLKSSYDQSMYIISGDHEMPTRMLARELDIKNYFAETLPQGKADIITKLQAEGKVVCYIGDGINDSIALKKAHVSISLLGASTIATDTAQIILMNENLNQFTQLFDIAHAFDKNLNKTLMISILPGVFIVGGVFFFHLSLIQSIVVNRIGFASGFLNTMLPLIKHHRQIALKSNSPPN
ncbi:MAG: heavy metal translocating P-type ATPase [Chloroflexota bacterium]